MSKASGKPKTASPSEFSGNRADSSVEGRSGREYTDRNTFDAEALEELYRKNYGVTRTQINRSPWVTSRRALVSWKSAAIPGTNFYCCSEVGYPNLSGVELQPYALEIARRRLPDVSLKLGSALALHADESFDVVFTSGVLIHIAPHDLPRALDEIHRCSRTYIWGMEYYAPEVAEVSYRNHRGLLWKMDYARALSRALPRFGVGSGTAIPYLENAERRSCSPRERS